MYTDTCILAIHFIYFIYLYTADDVPEQLELKSCPNIIIIIIINSYTADDVSEQLELKSLSVTLIVYDSRRDRINLGCCGLNKILTSPLGAYK